MKIAIISDTHDNIPNIEKAINWLNKEEIKTLLHCGDVSTKETMGYIAKIFKGRILAVFGNMDIDPGEHWKFPKVEIFSETGFWEIDGKKIAIVHKPEPARQLAESGKYHLVFYGHTHKPWLARIATRSVMSGEEKICRLINPGEMAGQFYKPSFAVYETGSDKLELKILEKL